MGTKYLSAENIPACSLIQAHEPGPGTAPTLGLLMLSTQNTAYWAPAPQDCTSQHQLCAQLSPQLAQSAESSSRWLDIRIMQ